MMNEIKMKTCNKCKKDKELSCFIGKKGQDTKWCNSCRTKQGEYGKKTFTCPCGRVISNSHKSKHQYDSMTHILYLKEIDEEKYKKCLKRYNDKWDRVRANMNIIDHKQEKVKEEIREPIQENYTCRCGEVVPVSSKVEHDRTYKHVEFLYNNIRREGLKRYSQEQLEEHTDRMYYKNPSMETFRKKISFVYDYKEIYNKQKLCSVIRAYGIKHEDDIKRRSRMWLNKMGCSCNKDVNGYEYLLHIEKCEEYKLQKAIYEREYQRRKREDRWYCKDTGEFLGWYGEC